jgi:glycosyltransferase involved in cell wall biosynthesis
MHVLLTANYSPWSAYSGGGQRSTHNLAVAYADRGHDVTVVYTKPPWETVEVPAVPYRVRWAALPALRSRRRAPLRVLSPLFVARAAAGLLDTTDGPTVVHPQGEEGALLPWVCRPRGVPLVATPRYPTYPDALSARPRGLRAWGRLLLFHHKYLLLELLVRRADRVCPTSTSAASMVRSAYGLDADRVTIVPNGVTDAFLAADAAYRPDGPLVFFGRLAPEKGVDVLVEALARLAADGYDRRCLIIGRGPAEADVRRAVAARGLDDRVELTGWLDPPVLAERLAGAAAAVLPSREESFGNAMAESMAAGVPVVSTRAGSIPEVVRDGETGVLLPPDDGAALARAVARLLDDPERARALAAAGRRRVEAHFTWDAVAARYEQIFERVRASGATPSPDAPPS